MKMNKAIFRACAIEFMVFVAFSFSATQIRAAEKAGDRFSFGVVFPPPLREEAHDYFIQLIDKVIDVVGERAEIDIEMVKVKDEPGLFEEIETGRLDSAFMYLPMEPLNEKKDLPVDLEMILNLQRKKGAKYCIYSLSDEFSCDLAKQKKIFLSLYTYLPVREKLSGEGCDGPLWEVFSRLAKYDSTPGGFKAMVEGKVDLVATADFFETTILGSEEMKDVKSVWCSNYLPIWGLYIRKDVEPAIRKKVGKVLVSIHNDPLLEEWRTFFVAVNAKFVPPGEKLKKKLSELSEKAAKKGWVDELELFVDEYYKTVYGETLTFEKKK